MVLFQHGGGAFAPDQRWRSAVQFTDVARGVAFLRCAMVNVAAIGESSRWILLDAGLPGYADTIRRAAESRFGGGTRPSAIVLTHGHFDHVGSLQELLEGWDVPVLAHRLELPYLTGRSSYPPPDPLVGRGSMSLISRLYPRGPIDITGRVDVLPSDGSVPALPGWRWIHTPGHTPGHVSLFRDEDRCLLAGDAVVTTKQESLSAVLTQRVEMHGPPAYFTQDWSGARDSVQQLAALAPETLVAGHGQPMSGETMRTRLNELAGHFDQRERPRYGRYAAQAAVADDTGTVILPPDPLPKVLAGAGAAAAALGVVWFATAARRRAHPA
jgi:glyoxylase-like metal-dependent hydrolase (beta-lactamase superfamily II)